MQHEVILMVEDEDADAVVAIRHEAQKGGFRFRSATDPHQADKLLAGKDRISFAIIDLVLGDVRRAGLGVARQCRRSGIPVAFRTVCDDDDILDEARQMGRVFRPGECTTLQLMEYIQRAVCGANGVPGSGETAQVPPATDGGADGGVAAANSLPQTQCIGAWLSKLKRDRPALYEAACSYLQVHAYRLAHPVEGPDTLAQFFDDLLKTTADGLKILDHETKSPLQLSYDPGARIAWERSIRRAFKHAELYAGDNNSPDLPEYLRRIGFSRGGAPPKGGPGPYLSPDGVRRTDF